MSSARWSGGCLRESKSGANGARDLECFSTHSTIRHPRYSCDLRGIATDLR